MTIVKIMIVALLVSPWPAHAQFEDSLQAADISLARGGAGQVSIHLRNANFAVGGFTLRLALTDSLNASITEAQRGAAIANFEYFDPRVAAGSCKITALVNWPGGSDPPPLAQGFHEIARIAVALSPDAPIDFIDSLIFQNDSLPPAQDNSISDYTGYVLEFPELTGSEIRVLSISGIAENESLLPGKIELLPNYPNPFNAETILSFELTGDERNLELAIFDLLGNRLKSFTWEYAGSGTRSVVWDGRNEDGTTVASGVYFWRMAAENSPAQSRKMTLLR